LHDIPEGDEDIEAPPAKRHQKSGQLDPETNGHAPVAMPDNYPEKWKKKFAEGYQQTAETIDKVDTTNRSSGKAGPPPEPTKARRNKEESGQALPHADSHALGGVTAKHVTADEAAEDQQLSQKPSKGPKRTVTAEGTGYAIMDNGIENGQPDSRRRTSDSECSVISPFATADLRLSPDRAPTVVSLSQIDPEMLEDARGSQPVPIGFERPSRAESEGSEHDYMTVGPNGVPTAGLLQAGMNEPSGALGAPSELSLQHTTYRDKVCVLLLHPSWLLGQHLPAECPNCPENIIFIVGQTC